MASNQPTIATIIEKCGGYDSVAKDLAVSVSLVRKWPKIGIQWWHWHHFMTKGGYRAGDIYKANVAAFDLLVNESPRKKKLAAKKA